MDAYSSSQGKCLPPRHHGLALAIRAFFYVQLGYPFQVRMKNAPQRLPGAATLHLERRGLHRIHPQMSTQMRKEGWPIGMEIQDTVILTESLQADRRFLVLKSLTK